MAALPLTVLVRSIVYEQVPSEVVWSRPRGGTVHDPEPVDINFGGVSSGMLRSCGQVALFRVVHSVAWQHCRAVAS
jgi:hypothetical protein